LGFCNKKQETEECFLKLGGYIYHQGTYTLQAGTEKSAAFLPLTGVRYITMVLIPPCGVLSELNWKHITHPDKVELVNFCFFNEKSRLIVLMLNLKNDDRVVVNSLNANQRGESL
jgi:hypothetical protein